MQQLSLYLILVLHLQAHARTLTLHQPMTATFAFSAKGLRVITTASLHAQNSSVWLLVFLTMTCRACEHTNNSYRAHMFTSIRGMLPSALLMQMMSYSLDS